MNFALGDSVGIHQIFEKITVLSCSSKFLIIIRRKRIVKSPLDIFQKLRYTISVDSAVCKGNAIFSDPSIRRAYFCVYCVKFPKYIGLNQNWILKFTLSSTILLAA